MELTASDFGWGVENSNTEQEKDYWQKVLYHYKELFSANQSESSAAHQWSRMGTVLQVAEPQAISQTATAMH